MSCALPLKWLDALPENQFFGFRRFHRLAYRTVIVILQFSMDPNASPEERAAAEAAAMAAMRTFNIEAFTLLAIALVVTAMRTYVRITSVGFKNLWADDYLVVLAAVSRIQRTPLG